MRHRRVAMLELLQKHIRQRDLMDLHEQLVRLGAGYTSRRQQDAVALFITGRKRRRSGCFLRHLAQNVPRRPHERR